MVDGGWRMADGSQGMTPEAMIARTKDFADRVARLCGSLPRHPEAMNIRKQLGRSSSSVAANYRAAQRARSKAEFRAKLGIAEEEADESCHWLEAVIRQDLLPASRVEPLLDEARLLTAIIVAALKTAKKQPKRSKDTPVPSPIPHPPSHIPLIGYGFDLHRLEPGLRLVVSGIDLPHDRGCAAHSDGDVVFHAVTDAILGAIGHEDIGQLFPNDDPLWIGADSVVFVQEAVRRMKGAGYTVGNLDVTVILERPKLSPHKPAMREKLAEAIGCPASRINLKGKTHEGVDALGENRAVACHAVVLLCRDTPA